MALNNFGVVSEVVNVSGKAHTLFRGAQPDWDGYDDLATFMGVTTVFKLNYNDRDHDVSYGNIPNWHRVAMQPYSPIKSQILNLVKDISMALLTGNVFLHCTYGRDRTGLVIAAYRITVEGWTYDEAYEDMTRFAGGGMKMPFFDEEFVMFLKELTNEAS